MLFPFQFAVYLLLLPFFYNCSGDVEHRWSWVWRLSYNEERQLVRCWTVVVVGELLKRGGGSWLLELLEGCCRSIGHDPLRLLCHDLQELIVHVIRDCRFAKEVWTLLNPFIIADFYQCNLEDWISTYLSSSLIATQLEIPWNSIFISTESLGNNPSLDSSIDMDEGFIGHRGHMITGWAMLELSSLDIVQYEFILFAAVSILNPAYATH
ncbi:hypothetical protein F3Y22_tig00110377pilonHSYRG00094 [Hibiscus syriacus]|uniref:Uncharacterized protein n=1 Tax=Hibiscus syriacus TaxID=106335 RepID=A0A6A3ASP8_HIBSY|nr:hypothetical protein F3Y22_tig00110377pilonHSYRG00094 [Hibiscus syriacus]